MNDWLFRTPTALGGKRIFRLGLAANFGIDEDGVRAAMDRGVNLFLWTKRAKGLSSPLKQALNARRDSVAVVGYASIGWFGWGVRSGAESLLRKLGTDYLVLLPKTFGLPGMVCNRGQVGAASAPMRLVTERATR